MRFVFIFVVICFAFAASQAQRTNSGNEEIPNIFQVKVFDLNDNVFDFQKLKGNIFLISFGATWCSPCREELAALEELTKEYTDKPVKFFWVSIDEKDKKSQDLRDYARTVNFTFPILRDPKSEAYLEFSNRYRLPTILFGMSDGTIVKPIHFGMYPTAEEYKKQMRRRLNTMLQTEKKEPNK